MNTSEELEVAANQSVPENQAEPVPGPDHGQKKDIQFFSQKIKPTTLLVQHLKGQSDSSTSVQENGCLIFHTHRETPCRTSYSGAIIRKKDEDMQKLVYIEWI